MGIIEDLFSLKDKVAIVTGGGSGIGAAVAEGLAEAGATVVIAGRRENYLKESADRIASKGGTVLPIRADVTKYEDIQSLVAKNTRAVWQNRHSMERRRHSGRKLRSSA